MIRWYFSVAGMEDSSELSETRNGVKYKGPKRKLAPDGTQPPSPFSKRF